MKDTPAEKENLQGERGKSGLAKVGDYLGTQQVDTRQHGSKLRRRSYQNGILLLGFGYTWTLSKEK